MLDLHDITLTYPDGDGRLTALDHVDLSVPAGTATAVTGASGSGKSSLLAVAATLVAPDSGSVRIDDVDVARLTGDAAARVRRERLGIVFQQPNLIPSLTVREQLEVMARLGAPGLARLRGADRRDRIDRALADVGAAAFADRLPAALSGGQRQRVGIARAIVHEPAVLLVDEPTSALDQERGDAIIDLLVRLTHERSLATVVVTHERAHVPRFDDAVTMHDGRLTPGAETVVRASEPAFAAS